MESNQEPQFFATPADFRAWLIENHETQDVLWMGYYKKASGLQSINWPESVDQALCFGWIDGLRKSIDAVSYKTRFTPRRKTSTWSNVNLKRVPELIEMGWMMEAGMKAYENRKPAKSGIYSYEREELVLNKDFERRLKAEALAWEFFESLAPGYKRNTIYWVMAAKQEKTQEKRFLILLASCKQGLRIPMLR